MCGIGGRLNFDGQKPVGRGALSRMMRVMQHRGPDGQGFYLGRGVGLGHVRLAIIDVDAGVQPMSNEDGTIWIVFNGEIYNFPELRTRLLKAGHVFRTRTDTEVVVHLYEEHGAACVTHLRGMFAFAIWDERKRRLLLVRDRVGIKPLYYYQSKDSLVFASELKGLLAMPDVQRLLHEDAIDTFWTYRFLPGCETLLRGIHKLLPGHLMVVEAGRRPVISQYWDLKFERCPGDMTLSTAAEQLTDMLQESVAQHMISDGPVGFLLSGGVDSSALVALAARQASTPLRTYTVGFREPGIVDERPYARLVAASLGTRHHETTFSADQFWSFLPRLVWHLEEPVCEAPAVALHFVSKQASEHVKVLLSGEGGDEAFGGYSTYPNMLALGHLQSRLGPLRNMTGAAARKAGALLRSERLVRYGALMPLRLDQHYWSRCGSPLARLGVDGKPVYCSDFRERIDESRAAQIARTLFSVVEREDTLSRMLYVDTKTWLADDLLVKADKVTMANSLELRVPLLDHRILEFAASLPPELKVKRRETKRVLRKAFATMLPAEVLRRKKAGFPLPYAGWLARELRERVQELLLDRNAFVLSIFDRRQVGMILDAHARQGSLQHQVFSLIVLELWHQCFLRATVHPTQATDSQALVRGTRRALTESGAAYE
jgi:asparagine synthase (glutamine-hydrolysing)